MSTYRLTDPQFAATALISSYEKYAIESLHTITFASLKRRGIIKVRKFGPKRFAMLTALGHGMYNYQMHTKIRKWKEDLAEARDLKREG